MKEINMLRNQIKIGKRVVCVNKAHISMLVAYKHNKKLPINTTIKCCVCNTEFVKAKDNHVFCNIETCKDSFWNKIDPRKRKSKRVSNARKLISPAPGNHTGNGRFYSDECYENEG